MADFVLHPKTQELLDRMNRIGMRQDFFIDKEKAERCLSDIYQLYGLNIPTYTWVDDITNEKLLEILGTVLSLFFLFL